MIDGVEYLLNGLVTGDSVEDTKKRAKAEAALMRRSYQKVRLVRRHSFMYAIYTHG